MLPAELIKRRKKLYLTQAELAAKMGVSVTTISRWETGSRSIPPIARKLLEFLENEPLTDEDRRRRYDRMRREAEDREAALTPEERERAERFFGKRQED